MCWSVCDVVREMQYSSVSCFNDYRVYLSLFSLVITLKNCSQFDVNVFKGEQGSFSSRISGDKTNK